MFYIIEKSSQLSPLGPFEDCFVRFIPHNNNFHPALTELSLIYIRPLTAKKGYILCIEHNESLLLNKEIIEYNHDKLTQTDWKKQAYQEVQSLPIHIQTILKENVAHLYKMLC